MMNFLIDSTENLQVSDDEISALLDEVYVASGYTTSELAETLFAPSAVRKRGAMICARAEESGELAGMIVLVESDSPACRYAQQGEVEMHLLGVMPAYRRFGLAAQLINRLLDAAQLRGEGKVLLWTQSTMLAAQALYDSMGFVRVTEKDFTKVGRQFLWFEKSLAYL